MTNTALARRLAQFQLAAAIEKGVLVIRSESNGLSCRYSGRQFAEVAIPGVNGIEVRMLPSGISEIKIGREVFTVLNDERMRPSLRIVE